MGSATVLGTRASINERSVRWKDRIRAVRTKESEKGRRKRKQVHPHNNHLLPDVRYQKNVPNKVRL